MKRLDIEFNSGGLELSLFDGELWVGIVRADSGGFFEKSGCLEPIRIPEERLSGQTELVERLNGTIETSKALWGRDERGRFVYKSFENGAELDKFLEKANAVFDELRELLRSGYEVNVDCCMEREYWLSGDERGHGQKKRLKLMFDYGAWCLWIYDEYYDLYEDFNVRVCDDGSFNGDMPEELLKGQTGLMKMVDKLTDDYMGLFINNKREFDYKGFENRHQAEAFVGLLNGVWDGLKRVLGGKYKLYCDEPLELGAWYGESADE